jgi:hypothetical protein
MSCVGKATKHCGLDPDLVVEAYAPIYALKNSNYGAQHVQRDHGEAARFPDMDRPFNDDDLDDVLRYLPNGKAPGLDHLPHDAYKGFGELARSKLLADCNAQLAGGEIPEGKSRFVLIPTGKVLNDPLKMRPLSIQLTTRKIIEQLILNRVHQLFALKGSDGHHQSQAAYRSKFTTIDHLVAVQASIKEAKRLRRTVVMVSYDVKKAFDTICRFFAAKCVGERWGADVPRITSLAQRLLLAPMQAYYGGKAFDVQSGVPQGGILSPEIFNTCMDKLGELLGAERLES